MPKLREAEDTLEWKLREAKRLLGLPDLAPIADRLRRGKRHITRDEDASISFEEKFYYGEWGLAWHELAGIATHRDAGVEVWQWLATAAEHLPLDDSQAEILRRGLRQEMPEPPNRQYAHLSFEELLRRALRAMHLPDIPYSNDDLSGGMYPDKPREIIGYRYKQAYYYGSNRGAWIVLAEYATKSHASHICWELLAEAAKFLTLTDEQADMLRRGLAGVDVPQ